MERAPRSPVHSQVLPRLAVSPSSLQEDIRRQRTHRLLEPRSKAALRLAESPSSLQQRMRRHWTQHLLEPRGRAAAVLSWQIRSQWMRSVHRKERCRGPMLACPQRQLQERCGG